MDSDAPPDKLAQIYLKDLAPELAAHVHAFLHGGAIGGLPVCDDYAAPSIKLRQLHDALSEAASRKRETYRVMVLAVAVRLQTVILFETLKRTYQGRELATY